MNTATYIDLGNFGKEWDSVTLSQTDQNKVEAAIKQAACIVRIASIEAEIKRRLSPDLQSTSAPVEKNESP